MTQPGVKRFAYVGKRKGDVKVNPARFNRHLWIG
jgi:hypothetical protein